jgi:hypothetical protein
MNILLRRADWYVLLTYEKHAIWFPLRHVNPPDFVVSDRFWTHDLERQQNIRFRCFLLSKIVINTEKLQLQAHDSWNWTLFIYIYFYNFQNYDLLIHINFSSVTQRFAEFVTRGKLIGFLQKQVKSRNYYIKFLLQTSLTEIVFVEQFCFQASISDDLIDFF